MPESPEEWTTAGMTRRRYPRVKAPVRVRVVEPSGKTWVGEAHDLSPLGMKVKAGQVAPSSIVHLEFELPGGGPTLNVASFAVRNDPDGVAFSFVDLTRTAFALIRQAVDLLLLGRKLWILIIEDGDLSITGNFRWEGLILITGQYVGLLYGGGGNQTIYGGVVVNETANVNSQVEFDAAGNAKLVYSCQALNNVRNMRRLFSGTSWMEL